MIGTSSVLQGEYSDYYVPEQSFFGDGIKESVLAYTDLQLLVTDFETGKPISKAMISIDSMSRTAVCDDHGIAILNEISIGEFILDAIMWGYAAYSAPVLLKNHDINSFEIKMKRNC